MTYTFWVYSSLVLIVLQSQSAFQHPQGPAQFPRKKNACYIAAPLQALIAIPAWRSFIMSYPPKGCNIQYDHEILTVLQELITEYSMPYSGTCYKYNNLYDILWKKKIVKNDDFQSIQDFLQNLDTAFVGDNAPDVCGIYNPFLYEIIYERYKAVHTEKNNLINIALHRDKSVAQALEDEMADSRLTKKKFFATLPRFLWISFSINERTFREQQQYHTEILETIDITKFVEENIRNRFAAQSLNRKILYRLVSMVWASYAHFIAYVRYGDTWYVCNDLGSPELCEVVQNFAADFKSGMIQNKYGYRLFYPSALFYELVGQEQSADSSLLDLQHSLQLLS